MANILLQHGLRLEHFTSFYDMPSWLVSDIITQSQQEHIMASTPGDAAERFGSHEAFAHWFTNVHMLTLLSENNDLAGLAWFRLKPRIINQRVVPHTYAHRLYASFLRKGLSTPFAVAAHSFADEHTAIKDTWLSVAVDNIPAQKTYTSVGYVTVQEQGDRRIMVRESESQVS